MKTMVVVAHLDDETICCGGLLIQSSHQEDFQEVMVLVMCKGRNKKNSLKRYKAFTKIADSLGFSYAIYDNWDLTLDTKMIPEISEAIRGEIKRFRPQRIIVPSEYDLHQDHLVVSRAGKIASRNLVPELLEMYNPCSKPLRENYFDTALDITHEIQQKVKLLGLYTTEKIDTSEFPTKEYFKTIWREL